MSTKTCVTCKIDKPVNAFHANRGYPDGLGNQCKTCKQARRLSNGDQVRRKKRDWYASTEGRQSHRRSRLRSQYGLTSERYEAMLAAQNGRCAICATASPGAGRENFAVDHDHQCCDGVKSCGACVRGLLCSECNQALGKFQDDPERLMVAAAYLLQTESVFESIERTS